MGILWLERLRDFQRNAVFCSFMLVAISYCLLAIVRALRATLIPLVWALFFSLPLQRAVAALSLRCVKHQMGFRAAGEQVLVQNTQETREALRHTKLWPAWLQLRVKILRLNASSLEAVLEGSTIEGSTVPNSTMEGAVLCVGSMVEAGTELKLSLFLEQDLRYPALLQGGGALALDASCFARSLATCVVLGCMLCMVAAFVTLVHWGALSLQQNLDAYITGVQEFMSWLRERFKSVPEEAWERASEQIVELLTSRLPSIAQALLAGISGVVAQAMLFLIYLLFLLAQPIPATSPVVDVFSTYLFLKTLICLLFAALVSGLLATLECKLWPLFFILTFVLNYIPEIGAILVGILSVPAVLFDGSVPGMERRAWNTLVLMMLTLAFKFVTANVIEVRMYVSRGGEFMRMHPVVLMAMIFVFGGMLGPTGMFLAVPIVAAVKYFLVSSEMPAPLLHPLLCFIEGDSLAPRRNLEGPSQHGHDTTVPLIPAGQVT